MLGNIFLNSFLILKNTHISQSILRILNAFIAPQAHFVQEMAGYLGREKMMSGGVTTLLGVSTDDYGACADIESF